MTKKRLSEKIFGRQVLSSLNENIPLLEQWFITPLGRAFLRAQQRCLQHVLSGIFGRHILQLGILRDAKLYHADEQSQQLSLGPLAGGNIDVVSQDCCLPIATESVDIAIIHHIMEYSQHPHQLLKELTRVVLPSGYVVIMGFNPLSFIGLRSIFGRFQRQGIWHNQPLTSRRIADWLTLMDFTVMDVQYGFYQLPLSLTVKNKFLKRAGSFMARRQWPFGGFYCVLAKKQVTPLTPTTDYLQALRKSMIPIMEPSLYTRPSKKTSGCSKHV